MADFAYPFRGEQECRPMARTGGAAGACKPTIPHGMRDFLHQSPGISDPGTPLVFQSSQSRAFSRSGTYTSVTYEMSLVMSDSTSILKPFLRICSISRCHALFFTNHG